MRRFRWFALAVFFLSSIPLHSQQQTFDDRVTVEVVQVPVFVSRQGRAITGLTKDDFELYVNGDRQPIDYFEVATFTGPATVTPTLRTRRLFLLLFDLEHSSSYSFTRAREAARAFVKEGVARGDSFGVAIFTAANGIEIVSPFTRDERMLHEALSTFQRSKTGERLALAGKSTRVYVGRAPEAVDERPELMEGVERSPDDLRANFAQQLQLIHERAMQEIERQSLGVRAQGDLIDSLAELVRELQGIDGQKHVLLLSEGFDLSDAPDAEYGYTIDLTNSSKLGKMHARFRSAGVFLEAIDVKGKKDAFDTSGNNALFGLAFDTGGQVVHGEHDLVRGMGKIRESKSVTYILGFKPRPGTRARDNSLRVKVRGQRFGTEVRHRKAFDTARPETKPGDLYIADVMLNDIPQHGLDVDLGVRANGPLVQLQVAIDSRTLMALNAPKVEADAFVYIFRRSGDVARWAEKKVTVDFARAGDYYATNPIAFDDLYELEPGEYVAKVLVRSATGGLTGFATHKFRVVKQTAGMK